MSTMMKSSLTRPSCARPSLRSSIRPRAAVETRARKVSPLEKGGTLKGDKALGKDASNAKVVMKPGQRFNDPRFVNGTWDIAQFANADGETNWDAVIDAEVVRRRWLEVSPEPISDTTPVTFDLSEIPTSVWVRRFHLPEAELINGRATMVGFTVALLVDLVFHVRLVDQLTSPLGQIATLGTVLFCLFVRSDKDLDVYKELSDEATFYDKQWQATWEGKTRPSETEQ